MRVQDDTFCRIAKRKLAIVLNDVAFRCLATCNPRFTLSGTFCFFCTAGRVCCRSYASNKISMTSFKSTGAFCSRESFIWSSFNFNSFFGVRRRRTKMRAGICVGANVCIGASCCWLSSVCADSSCCSQSPHRRVI